MDPDAIATPLFVLYFLLVGEGGDHNFGNGFDYDNFVTDESAPEESFGRQYAGMALRFRESVNSWFIDQKLMKFSKLHQFEI